MQEYLKCFYDMSYHERTYPVSKTSKYSEKSRLAKVGFFTSGQKVTSKEKRSQRSFLRYFEKNRLKDGFLIIGLSKQFTMSTKSDKSNQILCIINSIYQKKITTNM
ncbi:hypothetical protein DDO03_17505 [Vibrio cholerae]|nr:hypothetical protein [Vibrio cholerae]